MIASFPSLGIYVHWPFCVSKCPYCDFNSHLVKTIDIDQWLQAYTNELKFSYAHTSHYRVKSIFFGGGTPSLMPPALMAHIIDTIQMLWRCDEQLEITFEANPTSSEAEKFKAFKTAGANRISIGIQAFNDEDLKFLKRPHDLNQGIKAIERAHNFFNRVSFDLIYARPNQTLDAWEKELTQALMYAPTHISLYQLTIEPGTAFQTAFARKEFTLPDESLSEYLYYLTEQVLLKKQLHAYEISNYAIAGEECQHNLVYWNYKDYIGIGPGAHGRITLNKVKYATRRHNAPDKWLKDCLTQGHGQQECLPLSSHDQFIEFMLMGLRLKKGIPKQSVVQYISAPLKESFFHRWTHLMAEGLVQETDTHMLTTDTGRLKLNGILKFLLT